MKRKNSLLYLTLMILVSDVEKLKEQLKRLCLNAELENTFPDFYWLPSYVKEIQLLINEIELQIDLLRELAKSLLSEFRKLESESTRKNIDSQFMFKETKKQKNSLLYFRLIPLISDVQKLKEQLKRLCLNAELENTFGLWTLRISFHFAYEYLTMA